jgi:hypothetical protein
MQINVITDRSQNDIQVSPEWCKTLKPVWQIKTVIFYFLTATLSQPFDYNILQDIILQLQTEHI